MTTQPPQFTTECFWQFSLSVYKHSNVEQLLLQAQNELNTNVNLALLCMWLNQQTTGLTAKQIECLHNTIAHFSERFTQPLRHVRQQFKIQQEDLINYDKLRTNLLDAELLLEQQEQHILISILNSFTTTSEMVVDNLEIYQNQLNNLHKSTSTNINLCDLNQYINRN